MKKIYSIVLISLLTTSSLAGDLARSFKEAAERGDAQEKERSRQAYIHLDLIPYYQRRYSPVFQSCLASTVHPDTSPFSFVAAIGTNGRVLRLYTDHETNIFACARQTLQKDAFPHPSAAPHYMHISMNFSK